MNQAVIDTPIGKLAVTYEEEYVLKVEHKLQDPPPARLSSNKKSSRDIDFEGDIKRQLRAYFSGNSEIFDIPFLFPTTPSDFRPRVWGQIRKIQYGKTPTYGKIADADDIKSIARAVGNACGANRLLLIVPCHRVVGKNDLGGWLGGKDTRRVHLKKRILDHEQKHKEKM